jgi:hypothetical protein
VRYLDDDALGEGEYMASSEFTGLRIQALVCSLEARSLSLTRSSSGGRWSRGVVEMARLLKEKKTTAQMRVIYQSIVS